MNSRDARGSMVLTRQEARRVDRLAIERFGLPGIVLMESAARGLADVVLREATRTGRSRVVVAAGPGNNGGDGLAAARILANAGMEVEIVLLEEPTAGDAVVHRRVVDQMGLDVRRWEAGTETAEAGTAVLVDSLFGTGLDRVVEGRAAAMIGWINQRGAAGDVVVASDVPSGLDADTGRVLGACVRADVTATFVAPKVGFGVPEAGEWVGRVVVVEIGVPWEVVWMARG